ncbi:MAG: FliO/MopB family protein [bacterium]
MKYLLVFFAISIFISLFTFFASAQSNVYSDYDRKNVDDIQEGEYSNFNALLRMTVSLLIVLSLIIGSVFLIKKLRIYKILLPNSKNPVSIISNISLGHRRSLCLVKVANEILVIGMTNTSMSLLSKIDADDYYSAMNTNSDDSDKLLSNYNKRDFPSILKNVMERFKAKTE